MRPADVARRRARIRYPSSPGLQGAYMKGWRARAAGRPFEACPYPNRIRNRAVRGWSPVWRTAWLAGYLDAMEERA